MTMSRHFHLFRQTTHFQQPANQTDDKAVIRRERWSKFYKMGLRKSTFETIPSWNENSITWHNGHTTIQSTQERGRLSKHARLIRLEEHPPLLKHVHQKFSIPDRLSVSQILQNPKLSSYFDFSLHKLLISFMVINLALLGVLLWPSGCWWTDSVTLNINQQLRLILGFGIIRAMGQTRSAFQNCIRTLYT